MSGHDFDYRFGRKNQWRRTMWNQAVNRLDRPARDCIALYLAGEEDLDRPVAKRKGFRDENLIAVERSKEVATALRADGVATIAEDITKVVRSWPGSRPLGVVWLDFTCDLSEPLLFELERCLFAPASWDSIFMLNLCRGRSSWINSHFRPTCSADLTNTKHRGMIALYSLANRVANRILDGFATASDKDEMCNVIRARFPDIGAHIDATTYSYRSNANQTFDSVIFRNPVGLFATWLNFDPVHPAMEWLRNPRAKRLIAATLAHRTMRQRRIGPYAERRP